jgi:curved DNA-binding protein CbpA
MTNYYATIWLSPNATEDEIKSAYRKLAREAHPDVNKGGTEQFCALAAAYEVLSEPARRRAYDVEFQRWLKSVGALACSKCGAANHVPPFHGEQKPVCGRCKSDLGITDDHRRAAAREALVYQAATVVDDLGGEVLAIAHDALRLGLGRLRRRWGLSRPDESQAALSNKPSKKR